LHDIIKIDKIKLILLVLGRRRIRERERWNRYVDFNGYGQSMTRYLVNIKYKLLTIYGTELENQ